MQAKVLFSVIILCSAIVFANGQTKIIALRSHSGSMADFNSNERGDNFGNPGPRLEKIVKISDTMVVIYNHFYFGEDKYQMDTISKHGRRSAYGSKIFFNSAISADSLKKIYQNVELVGFDKKIKARGKKKGQGIFFTDTDSPSPGNGVGLLILLITLFSLLLGYSIWKSQQRAFRLKAE